MKKSILILGAMSIMAISLNSCSTSFCECVEEKMKGRSNANESMMEKCEEEFGHMSRSEIEEKAKDC